MKLRPHISLAGSARCADRTPQRSVPTSAFTMIEIAISLAIIGFALVAIIGVLPTGLDVQKNNKRETLINQDANYLAGAIRSGARGLDDLTNYVIGITNYWTLYRADGTRNTPGPQPYDNVDSYTNVDCATLSCPDSRFKVTSVASIIQDYRLNSGMRIIGILSTPKYVSDPNQIGNPGGFYSNYTLAYMRALSGVAAEKFPMTNDIMREAAFAYRLAPEVIPYASYASNWTYFANIASASNQNVAIAGSNYWFVARSLHQNLHELRLFFRWPLLPGGRVGDGRQPYRFMVSGVMTNDPPGSPLYFFTPRFATNAP